jgi:hypothetical protein
MGIRKNEGTAMLKKMFLAGIVGTALLAVTCGRDAYSYLATSWGWARQSVRDQIPTTFELQRARQMIDQLEPEVRRSMRLVAREEIEIERLQGRIVELQSQQTTERENLQKLSSDLQSGHTRFVYAGRDYSADQVRQDLSHRFDRFKTNDQTLASLETTLNTRQQSLDQARRKVEEMLAMKQQLLAEVGNLEARQKMIEISHTASDLALDDSQLARTRELLDEIRSRIEVNEKMIVAEEAFVEAIPVDHPDSNDVVEQIADYFQPERSEAETDTLARTSR